MGDSERFDDSTVGPEGAPAPAGPSKEDGEGGWSSEDAPKSQLSGGSEGEKAQVRRSSIRPAPASFRPSKRDPGQLLRPAMVIHAGDVDAVVPLWDNSDPTPSQPSQPDAHAPPRVEPFALADDLARSDPRASLPSTDEAARPETAPPAVAPADIVSRTAALEAESRATSTPHAAIVETNAPETSRSQRDAAATVTPAALPPQAMPIRSAPPERGSKRPLHRNTLSHFGAPNRDARARTTDAALVVEAADNAPPTSPFNELIPSNPTESPESSAGTAGKGKKRSSGTLAAILAAIVLAGVFVAMMVGRSGAGPALGVSTAVAPQVVSEPSVSEPSVVANEPLPPNTVAAPVDSAAATATTEPSGTTTAPMQPDVASASAAAPPAASSPNVVRVTLDVRPMDAKVIYQGRLQPGPPYEFEVTKGKRMALEVVRFGFATQKVVLDGRKSSVTVGLVRRAGHPADRR